MKHMNETELLNCIEHNLGLAQELIAQIKKEGCITSKREIHALGRYITQMGCASLELQNRAIGLRPPKKG